MCSRVSVLEEVDLILGPLILHPQLTLALPLVWEKFRPRVIGRTTTALDVELFNPIISRCDPRSQTTSTIASILRDPRRKRKNSTRSIQPFSSGSTRDSLSQTQTRF